MVLRLRGDAPDWSNAKCLGTAPHREPGESEVYDPWFDEEDPSPVLAICNGTEDGVVCPMRQKCLEFATFNNEKYGVWGGMPEEDRRTMRRLWRWSSKMETAHPEWKWRSSAELQALMDERTREGKAPPELEEE